MEQAAQSNRVAIIWALHDLSELSIYDYNQEATRRAEEKQVIKRQIREGYWDQVQGTFAICTPATLSHPAIPCVVNYL